MPDKKKLTTADEVILLDQLKRKVEAELKTRKAAWQAEARPKQRDTALLGEDAIGTIGLVKGREEYKLTDEAAAIRWAQANRPELLDYSPRIRPADLAVLLKAPVDPETGELIPGFTLRKGEPYAQVRSEAGAAERIEEALRTGELDLRTVLSIEAPEPAPAAEPEVHVAEPAVEDHQDEHVVIEGEVVPEAGDQEAEPRKVTGRDALNGILLGNYGFIPDDNTLRALAELDDDVARKAVQIIDKLAEE